jgi:CheY-like chemotaxis protein
MITEHIENRRDKMGGGAPNQRRHSVLIADDNGDDRLFLKHAIARYAPLLKVVAEVEDGDEVTAYLEGRGGYANRGKYPLPELLIMDMRMPRMTGIEVLEWLASREFPSLRVAMLADSTAIVFKDQALRSGLSHFFPKTINPGELMEVVKKLQTEMEKGREGRYL